VNLFGCWENAPRDDRGACSVVLINCKLQHAVMCNKNMGSTLNGYCLSAVGKTSSSENCQFAFHPGDWGRKQGRAGQVKAGIGVINSEHTVMTSGPWAMRRRSPGVVWIINSFSIPPKGNSMQQQHVAKMMQFSLSTIDYNCLLCGYKFELSILISYNILEGQTNSILLHLQIYRAHFWLCYKGL